MFGNCMLVCACVLDHATSSQFIGAMLPGGVPSTCILPGAVTFDTYRLIKCPCAAPGCTGARRSRAAARWRVWQRPWTHSCLRLSPGSSRWRKRWSGRWALACACYCIFARCCPLHLHLHVCVWVHTLKVAQGSQRHFDTFLSTFFASSCVSLGGWVSSCQPRWSQRAPIRLVGIPRAAPCQHLAAPVGARKCDWKEVDKKEDAEQQWSFIKGVWRRNCLKQHLSAPWHMSCAH